jgi:hypothetical protein
LCGGGPGDIFAAGVARSRKIKLKRLRRCRLDNGDKGDTADGSAKGSLLRKIRGVTTGTARSRVKACAEFKEKVVSESAKEG